MSFSKSRIRSYVKSRLKITPSQRKALETMWPAYGVETKSSEPIDLFRLFGRKAPCILEIGFGMGESLFLMAKDNPDQNFLGVEVCLSGVGALLARIEREKLDNLRVVCADAWDILERCIGNNSLDRVQIFFPDPWPKRRHHKRRLINAAFVDLVADKLVNHGKLYVVTDWQPYAKVILSVLERSHRFENKVIDHKSFSSLYGRPLTKYERRGQKLGHTIWNLLFELMPITDNK